MATIDSKLTLLQAIRLKKGEKIVEYSNQIIELVGKIESSGHSVSEIEKKRALLRGLPSDYDITTKTIMSIFLVYQETVANS